ncbi:MAG: hypothetical protein HXS52_11415 [Theionarchaea archaeon]|nr:hypothetical protein [Theionarchaea archaeon]MBU7038530.1 hypothetical protein [Theionarchaea archaeon]
MKVLPLLLLGALICAPFLNGAPSQLRVIRFGTYYGGADMEIRNTDWSDFDIMILHPGTPENSYRNLEDTAFLIMAQSMKDRGVEIYFYLDIGCEKEPGGLYYSQSDRKEWLDFKKRQIRLFVRYAEGIFLDCVGPGYNRQPQFAEDVQELIDYVHYSGGTVIVSDLFDMMNWVKQGERDLFPYEADYLLLKGAWSITPDQYSDDWNPLEAISFAHAQGREVLGLNYGTEGDEDRIMFCYCASRIFGLEGFSYAWKDAYEGVCSVDVPYDLGAPLEKFIYENGRYSRKFERGTVFVDFSTHKGWIEGEASVRKTGMSGVLVLLGGVFLLYLKRLNHAKDVG